jgi:Ca2+-binding EF-hand superfamily protein
MKTKPISYQPLIQNDISQDAIDLLKNLLEIDYNERISAESALKHQWFDHVKTDDAKLSRNLIEALSHLGSYASTSKLIDAIQGFIARQIVTHKESKDLAEVFKTLDSNWDGKLSKDELFKYYKKSMPEADANEMVKNIFESADTDNSGFIEFSEFLRSSMDHNNLVSKKNLENAFKMIDFDNSGKLNRNEIQSILDGTALSGDKKWMKILTMADKNSDGEIDMKEFYDMLLEFK